MNAFGYTPITGWMPAQDEMLAVLGTGLAVEMFRQSRVLAEIEKTPHGSIIPTEAERFAWSQTNKRQVTRKRSADALEHAASWFVEKWPIPALPVYPAWRHEGTPEGGDFHTTRIDRLRQEAGMHWHRIHGYAPVFSDAPDVVLAQLFAFFGNHAELPALLLMSFDGEQTRAGTGRPPGERDFSGDGHHDPAERTEAIAALLFARPRHVAAPSSRIPQSWTPEQVAQMDVPPTLGYVLRPHLAWYVQDGRQLDAVQQQAAFLGAWSAALAALPDGVRPARVFYDYGPADHGRKIVPLARALAETDPAFDLFTPGAGINLSDRLGELGASSPFVGIALAVMASHAGNDVSAVVNLRRDDGASIAMVWPTDDRRPHPAGDPLDFPLVPDDE
jgi:hypothetical protein